MSCNKKKLLYISHPSGGLPENTAEIEQIVIELYKNEEIYNNFCIVSPVHCYGFMYNMYETDYYKGLSFCTDLLKHCDIMLVTGSWKNSRGCRAELKMCNEINIPYLVIENVDDIIKGLDNKSLVRELLNKLVNT